MFTHNNKDTKAMSEVVLVFLLLTLNNKKTLVFLLITVSQLFLVFLLLTLNIQMFAGKFYT